MDGFERRKEQNREKIVRAATGLFSRLGIGKVSINDIARQARVSQVTIYNLFGGKDGLIEACLKSFMPAFLEQMRAIIKQEKPYLAKLEDIFRYFVQISESSQGLGDINLATYPQFKELEELYTNQINDVLVEFVREGQREGYLNEDISEEAVKAFIEIFIQGINANPELHARTHHNPQLFHDLLHLMLFGFSRVDDTSKARGAPPPKRTRR
jgi:AcrR family transcriptional regulator